MVRSCSLLSFLLDVSVRTFRPKAPHVTLSSEGRPLLAVSGSLWGPAGVPSHVLWIVGGRLQLRGHKGLGQSVAPVMCLTPSSYLSSWMSEIAKESCPSCGSVADWRASVSARPGSAAKRMCQLSHIRKKRELYMECRNRTTHNAKVCCLTAHSTKTLALGFSGFSLAV